jgi:very-short-patch-repair endonuclease
MSLPELLLWNELRRDRLEGLRFRRQHPFGRYVLDFYSDPVRLVVEVDGAMHFVGDRPERDAERNRFLQTAGLRVLRLPARLVLKDMTAAIDTIVHAVTEQRAVGAGPRCSPLGELSARSDD